MKTLKPRGPLLEGVIYKHIFDYNGNFSFNKNLGHYQYLEKDDVTFIDGEVPSKILDGCNNIMRLGLYDPTPLKEDRKMKKVFITTDTDTLNNSKEWREIMVSEWFNIRYLLKYYPDVIPYLVYMPHNPICLQVPEDKKDLWSTRLQEAAKLKDLPNCKIETKLKELEK